MASKADDLHQAGGGVSGQPHNIKNLNASLVTYLNKIFASHANKEDQAWHRDDIAAFLKQVQEEGGDAVPSSLLSKSELDFNGFLAYMTSASSSIIAPAKSQDLSWPLSSYFISSSHNTYLTGNQLYSMSSTDAYKNVLLRGCRCIEVDVWDGDESDAEGTSGSSSDDGPEKYAKRKDRVNKVKGKLPRSFTSRLKETSLGERLKNYVQKKTEYVEKKTEPKQAPNAPPAAAAPAAAASTAASETSTAGTGSGKGTATAASPPAKTADSAPLKKSLSGTSEIGIVEPKVYHGYTLTKEVSFRDVCYAIRDHAFTVSDLPLIVSLEVHCGPQQQQLMVDIMEQAFKGYLIEPPSDEAKSLPSPELMRNKILVKVKYAPPAKDGEAKASPELATADEEGESPLQADAAAKKKKKKAPSKIIQALSQLGVYTRGVSFKSLMQPEASMPTHIFSLSEKGVLEVHEKSSKALFDHNKHFLMRTYPSGLRIGSSNLDPVVFWRKGIQVVALNWQNWDEGMMLNEGMFAGTKGYMLKPEGYRGNKPSTSGDDPTKGATQGTAVKHRKLDLTVEVFAAQNLPLPHRDDNPKSFRPYVKVELHVEEPGERHGGPAASVPEDGKEKEGEYKTRTKTQKGVDPDFGREALKFAAIPGVVEELSFVRFTVRDDEFGRDDLAAWACVRLDRLRSGYRFVRLMDCKGVETQGFVLVKISKRLF